MAGSLVVQCRKRIRDDLSVLFEADPVVVTYAWDPESREQRQIFTLPAEADHRPASIKSGRVFREEDARIQLVVHVDEPGASPEEADDVAMTYGVLVEEFFADNADAPLDGVKHWQIGGLRMAGGPTGQSSISQLIYTVTFQARLT